MKKLIAVLLGLGLLQFSTLAGEDGKTAKETTTTTAETPDLTNWITVGAGGVLMQGDGAQFQQRRWTNNGAFGGIEDFHWEPKINDKVTLKIDGHALNGIEDYLGSLELTVQDIGYIKAGYSSFRTWYDGHGGYLPSNDLSFDNLYDNDFSIDRKSLWGELGLRIPKWPEITVRYERQERYGQKDSTIWGDTGPVFTGLPPPNNTRNIVPTFLNIDEKRDILTLDLKYTFANTDVGAGFRYEHQDNDDSRNIHRRPGEVTTDRFVTQHDTLESDLFAAHAYQTTRLSDKLQFSTAYTFTTFNSDIGGSRIYGASYDPIFDPLYPRRQRRDEGFINLFGGSQLDQHVVTLALAWRPWKDWMILPSFRYEHNELNSIGQVTETNVPASGPLVVTLEPVAGSTDRSFHNTTESIEVRYTGLKKWTFYAKGEWVQEELDQNERDLELSDEVPLLLIGRDTTADINAQKYVVGANCYYSPLLSMATQYYHKIFNNDYDHPFDTTPNAPPSGDRYPAFLRTQDFEVDDFNVRVTVYPFKGITFVSRYDYQRGTVDTRGDFLEELQSGDTTAHIFSETITWNPMPRLYLQGSGHYVRNRTDTPADDRIDGTVQNMKNNYWNAGLAAGYAVSDKTDLRVNYQYYRADDFSDNSLVGVPYLADDEEHAVTVTLTHEFTDNIRGSLKYGFFNYRNAAYGDRNNYDAHLLAASLQYRF